MGYIKKHFWLFGLFSGLVISLSVTLIIVIWELLENPNGLFRGINGINWDFVYDTAESWFIPTFIYVVLIASAAHLLMTLVKWFRQALSKRQT
jgi:hypothetical protein